MLSAVRLPQVRAEACISLQSQLRTKYSSSNCPNHVRRTKSSVKKRLIVRRTVRSIFDEQTLAQLRTGFSHVTGHLLWLRNLVTYSDQPPLYPLWPPSAHKPLYYTHYGVLLLTHCYTHYGVLLLTSLCTILTMASFCPHTSVLYSLWPPSAHTPLYYTHYGLLLPTHRCTILTMASFCPHTAVLYSLWRPCADTPLSCTKGWPGWRGNATVGNPCPSRRRS